MLNHNSTISHRLLALAHCAICLASTAYAGAWTQKQGSYYFKLAANSVKAHSDFDANGARVTKPAMGQLQDSNLAAYVEYGLRDRLTLVASTPYKRLTLAVALRRRLEHRRGGQRTDDAGHRCLRPRVAQTARGAHSPSNALEVRF